MEVKPDLCLFSGDKLLGGPQAGILVGKAKAVEAVRKNPMFRAMRLDKLILAALEATLRLHAEGDAARTVPALERLNWTAADLKPRAKALLEALVKCGVKLDVALEASTSEAGSGSAPTIPLETWCVVLTRPGEAAAETARRLRLSKPAVFARVRDGRVWLDPRTLAPGDDDRIVEAVRRAFA
jgi:L-seryl-tRNA(Ser) seleniumtransferase